MFVRKFFKNVNGVVFERAKMSNSGNLKNMQIEWQFLKISKFNCKFLKVKK